MRCERAALDVLLLLIKSETVRSTDRLITFASRERKVKRQIGSKHGVVNGKRLSIELFKTPRTVKDLHITPWVILRILTFRRPNKVM